MLNTAQSTIGSHRPFPKPSIADDLASLLAAALSFRTDNVDPELGRTTSLNALRNIKGLLIAELSEAIASAEQVGARPRQQKSIEEPRLEVTTAEIDPFVPRLLERLDNVDHALSALELADENQQGFPQQQALLTFYLDSMRAELNLARLQLLVGNKGVDLAALARAVEVMADLTGDFLATVKSWGARLVGWGLDQANKVSKTVRKAARGVGAVTRRLLTNKRRVNSTESPIVESITPVDSTVDKPTTLQQHAMRLRRFAFALAGSLEDADRIVATALGRAVSSSMNFKKSDGTIDNTFLFDEILRIAGGMLPKSNDRPASRYVASLPTEARQVFLLTAMEGFSAREAGSILRLSEAKVRAFIDATGVLLGQLLRTDVLVIEDDEAAARDICSSLEMIGHTVVGVAKTADQAVALGRTRPVGLITADIQLADGSSGLSAVNEILQWQSVPVVFITAYPERFLTGRRPEPAFLVSKPYDRTALLFYISAALFFSRKAIAPT
ncbi:response regulator [Bradyrhizobium sp. 199]|uniref:response regulator n=1 Tax=Bradyrhizobium sp. 199 TaxID=2782664 RepID=UPI001FF7179C|nr:response regulator [Bradyrhizobium sp. 199]MCK1362286.1 response regulator [Bradyrhizobium sp. 199]